MPDQPDQPNPPVAQKLTWKPLQLVAMCAVCLVVGLVLGFLVRGSAPDAAQPVMANASVPQPSAAPMGAASAPQPQQAPQPMPTLDDMKRMADKKAEPLLDKLKSDPRNPQLLNQVGLLYEKTHQFKEAAGYFEKSLQYDPKNIAVRADYASCLYYSGDVDGALAQLNKSLTYDPKHAGTLMNIGIIKWKGKNDPAGAVASWKKLLALNPNYPQKDLIEHMISEAEKAENAPAPAAADPSKS